MSDMKCPFCNESLVRWSEVTGLLKCPGCMDTKFLLGNSVIWQALINSMKEHDLCHDALVERTKELDRTRKALEITLNVLKGIEDYTDKVTEEALEQMTALEQKDK